MIRARVWPLRAHSCLRSPRKLQLKISAARRWGAHFVAMRRTLSYLYTACARSCQCYVRLAARRIGRRRTLAITALRVCNDRAQHLQCAIHKDVTVMFSRV